MQLYSCVMGGEIRANANEYADAFTVERHLNMGTLMRVRGYGNYLSGDVECHL